MGDIGVLLKLMPEDTETDLERIKDEIKNRISYEEIKEEDVAFGLKAIKVLTVVEDKKGGTSELEEKLSDIEGVRELEVEDVNKL